MLYKTKNGQQDGFVPGVGQIVNGMIESPVELESANLELVEEKQETPTEQPAQPTTQVTASAAPVVSPPPVHPAPQPQPQVPAPSPQHEQLTNTGA